jgi:hypothetical protein
MYFGRVVVDTPNPASSSRPSDLATPHRAILDVTHRRDEIGLAHAGIDGADERSGDGRQSRLRDTACGLRCVLGEVLADVRHRWRASLR